ncbi:integrase core domain-containing protein [Roseixanthobacter glucoisosaccharinicivorans]|uniref:integrase core domain-containing protein n=1 Tax=Roseixanthobacter glucoisosaccharinicivorans TaxID=3119923 RepID=UPI00372D0941
MQSAFIECFNGAAARGASQRSSVLGAEPSQSRLERAGDSYNVSRPHSAIGWQTPSAFATIFRPRRDRPLLQAGSSAPSHLTPPNRADPTAGANSPLNRRWGQHHRPR